MIVRKSYHIQINPYLRYAERHKLQVFKVNKCLILRLFGVYTWVYMLELSQLKKITLSVAVNFVS